jgi:hypothetical protein
MLGSGITKRRSLIAALLCVFWICPGEALSALPDTENCRGCHGVTGYGDEAYAPAPCTKTPYGSWSITVTTDVFDGECSERGGGDVQRCLGTACESTTTYAWGGEVADADLEIGFKQSQPAQAYETIYAFPEEGPWEKGKVGALTFKRGDNPDIACGTEVTFFIRGELCGDGFEASVVGTCTKCKPRPKVDEQGGPYVIGD